ncbi:MAG: terminase large subunit [Turicibacter sp.]|nr:terminase large subunit [Turicibacter sp.]
MNPIKEYTAAITSGEITAGRYVQLLYANIENSLDAGLYFFDEKKAANIIAFIETMCHHSKGRSDLITLELWQKAMISCIFGLVDADGWRVFREVFVLIGRKNGKSILASTIIAAMAFLDDEYGAEIYCLAPKLGQANIVFEENFLQMLQAEPELFELTKKRRGDLYIPHSNTIIKPIAFNYKKADGYNPHLTVADELAAWPAATGLKQYQVMKSGRGARRQPLILSITTAGDVNDGIFDELFTRSTRWLEDPTAEDRLLPFLYMIDDVGKWDDVEELKKANPNMGVSVFRENFLDDIKVAKNSLPERVEFLMKHANIKQNSSTAWINYELVQQCLEIGKGRELADFREKYGVGGIDLSQYTDLTAASAVLEMDGILYGFVQFFIPGERLLELQTRDGVPYDIYRQQGFLRVSGTHKIDYKDVLEWFLWLEREYRIRLLKVGYDRNMAAYLIDDLAAAGFHVDDVHQGENLSPVIKEFEGFIREGRFGIGGGNNLLAAHFLNVALKQNTESRRVKPVKMEQRAKIDGFVSVICAMTVRQKYFGEIGWFLENLP